MTTYTNPPTHCDICRDEICGEFVDGATTMGPWANMCPRCFRGYAQGLGPGVGQRYVKNEAGQYVKQAG